MPGRGEPGLLAALLLAASLPDALAGGPCPTETMLALRESQGNLADFAPVLLAADAACRECIRAGSGAEDLLACAEAPSALLGPAAPPGCPELSAAPYGQRYCELLVSDAAGLTTVWKNNNESGRADECADFADLSLEEIEAQWPELREPGASLIRNGPRRWVITCSGFNGLEHALRRRDSAFRGLPARAVGTPSIAFRAEAQLERLDQVPYAPAFVNRDVIFHWSAGTEVYELLSDGGCVYIMQSLSNKVNASLAISDLPNLAARLTLPANWTFRSRVPGDDVRVVGDAGVVPVLRDDLENTYSCLDGQTCCQQEGSTPPSAENSSSASGTSMLPAKATAPVMLILACRIFA